MHAFFYVPVCCSLCALLMCLLPLFVFSCTWLQMGPLMSCPCPFHQTLLSRQTKLTTPCSGLKSFIKAPLFNLPDFSKTPPQATYDDPTAGCGKGEPTPSVWRVFRDDARWVQYSLINAYWGVWFHCGPPPNQGTQALF